MIYFSAPIPIIPHFHSNLNISKKSNVGFDFFLYFNSVHTGNISNRQKSCSDQNTSIKIFWTGLLKIKPKSDKAQPTNK